MFEAWWQAGYERVRLRAGVFHQWFPGPESSKVEISKGASNLSICGFDGRCASLGLCGL